MSERYFDPHKITGGEQCLVGSFTGEVGSYNATEPHKGWLILNRNQDVRVKAKASLTARPTSRAGAKAGLGDPVVLSGRAIAQRIKGTPGITGSFCPSVHSDGKVWHLDVGSSHPGGGLAPKGWTVRPLKRYASWVQNVEHCVA